MSMPRARVDQALLQETPAGGDHLPRRLLMAARAAWVVLAGLILVLFILAAPRALAAMQALCTGRLCIRGQVHVSAQWMLERQGIAVQTFGTWVFTLQIVCVLAYFAVAGLIFWRRSDDRMALLGAAMLLAWGATAFEFMVVLDELAPIWAWLVRGLGVLGTLLLTYFCYLFPTGRFMPRWTRWLASVWVAGAALQDVVPAVAGPSPLLGRLTSLFFDAWLASLAIAQLYRYRHAATATQRRQTRWVIAGVAVGIGGYAVVDVVRLAVRLGMPGAMPAVPLASSIAYYVLMLLVPLAFGVAIMREGLYDIGSILNRTLVYGTLTACVVGLYILVVGYLGTLFHAEGSLLVSLVATGLVAVLFQPLRERLQRAINRLMYGDRDDPYAVISRLGRRLETALAPDAVLPAIVQTVREALKLPYVAIELAVTDQARTTGDHHPHPTPDQSLSDDAAWEIVASAGKPAGEHLVLPLVYQGEPLGRLVLGPRAPGDGWNAADRRLLADLARQTGTAVHAIRLTLDLQQARARLVAAREEERRRLRRDLHDGLGPVLASLALQADTARELVPSDPAEAVALLDDLTAQAQGAVVDIRRLVHALRPPALDDLGLVPALQGYAGTITRGGVAVAIAAPDPFPPLPAAVEVAAYRIVQEAVTNVVRHARAGHCAVRLVVDDTLRITVEDDGRGVPDARQAGVGLTSMRERARELGGDFQIGPAPGGGTVVHAWLPL